MQLGQPKRVIVFCLSGLGDAILASPALAALKSASDRFELTLLTMFPSVAEYLRDQDFTNDVRIIKFLGMSKTAILQHTLPLRRERFDISVTPYAMNRLGYNVFSLVVGAKERIGFQYQRQGWINLPQLNHCVIVEDPSLHAVEENLRWAEIVTGLDRAKVPDDLRFKIQPDSAAAAQEFLAARHAGGATPLIGIHASCNSLKNQQRRCWSPSSFSQLIQRLAVDLPAVRFVLFEGPADAEINRAILEGAGTAAPKVVVTGALPMRVVSALIQRCHLFLSNDSGLMHTAAASRVPCVAIFGPTNPVWVRPWKTRCEIVSRHLPCSPCFCYSSRPLSCPAKLDFACVRELPLEDVKSAVVRLLKEPRIR